MADYEIQAESLEAIHIYHQGTEHIGSMDCICEPVTRIQMEHGERTISIIVHGTGIEVGVAIRGKEPPELGG